MHYIKYFTHITLFNPHNNPMRNTITANALQTRKLKHIGLTLLTEGPQSWEVSRAMLEALCSSACQHGAGSNSIQLPSHFVGHK